MKKAFTLIELSIVLIIIGLLVGGVLAGRDLIKQAELASVSRDINKYMLVVNTFQLKYGDGVLPGDMNNATDYWGAANTGGAGGECASPDSNTGTGTQTCNGDGDGWVAQSQAAQALADRDTLYEAFRFWQHLANAEMISGTYTGIAGADGAAHHVPGENTPLIAMNAGFSIFDVSQNFTGFIIDSANAGNAFLIGLEKSPSETTRQLFTPAEALGVDTKLDDSKPGTGKILAFRHASCTDASGASDTDADYLISDDTVVCNLVVPNVGG